MAFFSFQFCFSTLQDAVPFLCCVQCARIKFYCFRLFNDFILCIFQLRSVLSLFLTFCVVYYICDQHLINYLYIDSAILLRSCLIYLDTLYVLICRCVYLCLFQYSVNMSWDNVYFYYRILIHMPCDFVLIMFLCNMKYRHLSCEILLMCSYLFGALQTCRTEASHIFMMFY